MRHYRLGAHTKSDLKVHLVWTPKYRKAVLVGEVAIRVRALLRQIAAEHELEIVSGKVARDHMLSVNNKVKPGQCCRGKVGQ
ncbi:MAG: transposase [Acidobacteriaceae bacterium]